MARVRAVALAAPSAWPRVARTTPRLRLCALLLACAAATALALMLPALAAADRAYTIRFTANAQGDITGAGNTLLTCVTSASGCADGRNGQGGTLNNNDVAMQYVDVDHDSATFDSSTAKLTLPAGARVLFAGLYYGGRWQAGTGGVAGNSNLRNKVLFQPPNRNDYLTLTASPVDDAPAAAPRLYQGFVDVTKTVAAAGAGDYTVANVQLGTGKDNDQSGGWALAVAYEDATQPTRNLTIFDGFEFVSTDVAAADRPVDIPLSGFVTPRSGPVTTRIGLVALEGDLGTNGDSATINARPRVPGTVPPDEPACPVAPASPCRLNNGTNPANNFFNASISSRTASPFTAKNPNYANQFGFDADIIDASNLLANNQTSTTIRLNTNGDGFAPQAVSFATDLFAPSLNVAKAVDKPVARAGDELTYTINVSNTGQDASVNTTLHDVIPNGTQYVPGSLAIGGVAQSDAPGDDNAEFDAAGNQIVARIGDGANASNGGRLAIGASAAPVTFRVKVTVDASHARGFTVRNNAGVGYIAETLQQPGSVTSPDVLTKLQVPDLAIDKSHTGEFVSGRTVPFTLLVTSLGDVAARGTTTVTDTLDPSMSFVAQPTGDGWDCTGTAGRALKCTRSGDLPPGDPIPPITYTARVAADTPASKLINTARVSNAEDGNPLNDVDIDGGENRPPSVDLAISKVALTPIAFPGSRVRFLVRVINRGPDTATNVRVTDVAPPGLTILRAVPSKGFCAAGVCRLGRLRPGEQAFIIGTALAADDTGGRTLVNRATVTGREPDINPDNNTDTAPVRIIPLVDIAVDKSTAAPQIEAGGNATFLVVVSNNGPSDATNVIVRDLLPPELQPVSATPTQGTCPTPTTCNLGPLDAGAHAQIVVVARSDASLAGRTVTNTAVARAREPDSNLSNNFDTAPVTFVAPPPLPADVVVTKTASTTNVNVGESFSYTVTARNRGPGPADNVVVTDTPDPALQFVSAVPSQGTCTSGVPVRCDLGPLAPGASATVVVTVIAVAAGSLSNSVTAITPTPTPTPTPTDQIAVAGVTVQSPPRVLLRKRGSPRIVRAGGQVTWTLTATARGSGTAHNVTVCDRLPRGFTMVSSGGARLRDGRWCVTIPSLRAGSSRTVQIVTRAPSVGSVTRFTNVATLTVADEAPRTARARVRVLPPGARFTG